MNRFLPASDQAYAIPNNTQSGFTEDDATTMLAEIGNNMNVSQSDTEVRVPSPFSRAYSFYIRLTTKGIGAGVEEEDNPFEDSSLITENRVKLQEEARQTFRGIVSTFILHKLFNLEIKLANPIRLTGAEGEIYKMMAPTLGAAPVSSDYWDYVYFYTIKPSKGQKEEVLCGLSPLTGFFPPGKHPSGISGLYWYDKQTGKWSDPTKMDPNVDVEFTVDPNSLLRIRKMVKRWLREVLDKVSFNSPDFINLFGATAGDVLYKEFDLWYNQLDKLSISAEDVLVESYSLPSPGAQHADKKLPIFEYICKGKPSRNGRDHDHHESLQTDLGMYDNQLLVTETQITNSSTRIYGRHYGTENYRPRLRHLKLQGNNLGQALGLGDSEIPVPYMFVDRLFTKHLTAISDDDGFSPEWQGLHVESDGDTDYCLFPFTPKILEIMSREDIVRYTEGRLDEDQTHYIIELNFRGVNLVRRYAINTEGDYTIDRKMRPRYL